MIFARRWAWYSLVTQRRSRSSSRARPPSSSTHSLTITAGKSVFLKVIGSTNVPVTWLIFSLLAGSGSSSISPIIWCARISSLAGP
ncbi:hypothetical protein D3C86_1808390 [compost metagenome]